MVGSKQRVALKGRPPLTMTCVRDTGTDRARCLALLGALSPDPESLTLLVVEGEPRSKARPRFSGKGHAYTPTKQREAEAALSWRFRAAIRDPLDGNLAVVCLFFRRTHGRVDVDNMLKQVLDAANGICWKDDMQVTAILGIVELDRENPRTVLAIAPHTSTLDRSSLPPATCKRCGAGFQPESSRKRRSFCSTTCASRSVGHDLSEPIACGRCGTSFKRKNFKQQFCSQACRLAALHQSLRRPHVVVTVAPYRPLTGASAPDTGT